MYNPVVKAEAAPGGSIAPEHPHSPGQLPAPRPCCKGFLRVREATSPLLNPAPHRPSLPVGWRQPQTNVDMSCGCWDEVTQQRFAEVITRWSFLPLLELWVLSTSAPGGHLSQETQHYPSKGFFQSGTPTAGSKHNCRQCFASSLQHWAMSHHHFDTLYTLRIS